MRNLLGLCRQVLSGLRFRLLLLVLLTCAPLVALTVHNALKDRRKAIAEWMVRVDDLLQETHQSERELIGETGQLLLALSQSADVQSLDKKRCQDLMTKLLSSYQRYSNIGVVSTNGRVLASALPVNYPVALANNELFARAQTTAGFVIGNFPEAEGPNHLPVLLFGYPVLGPSNSVRTVVFAEMNMKAYNRSEQRRPSHFPLTATWTVIDREGRILARHPDSQYWIGRSIPAGPLRVAAFLPHPELFEAKDDQGVPTMYAVRTITSQLGIGELAGLLAIPKRDLFEAANKSLLQNLAWLCLAVGVALGLGWVGSRIFILRSVAALARSSARLAGGDLSVRTGLPPSRDELGQLALAFDKMAQSIEEREAERQRAQQNLQVLSHRLVEVQETERRHIARELHDEIGQSLTAAARCLQTARQMPASELLQQRLSDSLQAVEHVLVQVRDLSLNLRPSVLDDLGLESAIRWFLRRQKELTGMETEFQCDSIGGRLEPLIETECFRVAQEALTNITRHAAAKKTYVQLRKMDGQIHLLVRDDGVGFDVVALRQQAADGASLGLLSMEERSALAGGGFELRSSPGHGTEVHAWFPFRLRPEALTPTPQ